MKNITRNLIHRLMGEVIVKNNVKVQPPMEGMLKVEQGHIQIWITLNAFTPLVDISKENKTLAFLGHFEVERNFSFSVDITQRTGCKPQLKTKKVIANKNHSHYANHALSKILKLALAGYILNGVHSASSGFFVRNFSMRSHVMAKLERDTSECAGNHLDLSANPFQLCHPHLAMNGKAPKLNGVHTHA